MDKRKTVFWTRLVISLLVGQLAGLLGSIFTTPAIPTWYAFLNKPAFTPPSWLFPPVWTGLFLLMGISLFLVWNQDTAAGTQKRKALVWFGVQWVLNVLWSILFFGLRSPLAAWIEIVVLWIAILLTIVHFSRISLWAGRLLVPYLLWVSFAAILNGAIVLLN